VLGELEERREHHPLRQVAGRPEQYEDHCVVVSHAHTLPDASRPRTEKCGRGDSNPHARGHQNLNLTRLPVTPLPPEPSLRAAPFARAAAGRDVGFLAGLRGWGEAADVFPLFLLGSSAVYLVLAIPLGRLADRIGRRTVFIAGNVGLVLLYLLLLLAFVPAWFACVGCLALLGTYYAATDGVLSAAAAEFLPVGLRSSGLAAFTVALVVVLPIAARLLFAGRTATTDAVAG
jgi:hypothetical protein